jgi:serine kinase of HPr protein (carbohydrate metabolism regulator)
MAKVIVKDLVEKFGLKVIAGEKGLNRPVQGGYCGDLLSDVMGNAQAGSVWLTIQGHQNIIAVAVLREMAAIILTSNTTPQAETQEKADEEAIPLLQWSGSTYELAGRFHAAGIHG